MAEILGPNININNTGGAQGSAYTSSGLGIELSETTKKKRNQIKVLQDEFMTFSWDGYDAFENFGAFIINDKQGSLKFYNGPSFSNEYSQPQFDKNGGQLLGVTFSKQVISFSVGVYWISIDDYRKLLNWLNPEKISYLIFGYNRNYRYNVKLSSLGDSTRWVVGKENVNGVEKNMYYTELKLSFELQGENCAIGTHPYEFSAWEVSSTTNTEVVLLSTLNTSFDFTASDLDTPFVLNIPLNICQNDNSTNQTYQVSLYLESGWGSSVELFNVELFNLTHAATGSPILQQITVSYDSLSGILFLKKGASSGSILSLLSLNDIGERIVKSYQVFKTKIPGNFSFPNFYKAECQLKLIIKKFATGSVVKIPKEFYSELQKETNILCYPRTNIA